MSKNEKCRNCKYHYIEELSFDYPQSCCSKRNAVIEAWCNCSEFEYSENYINELQQENKQLKDNWNKLKEYIKDRKTYYKDIGYENTAIALSIPIDKMQEIEGSDDNETA